jgi:hypothetical protein
MRILRVHRAARLALFCIASVLVLALAVPAFAGGVSVKCKPKPKPKPVTGVVNIKGKAECPDFATYTLDYAAESPTPQWTNFVSSATPVRCGILGKWETAALKDGTYLLELKVTNKAGTVLRSQVRVAVDNTAPEVSIASPADGQLVDFPADVTGSATDGGRIQWKLTAQKVAPLFLAHLDRNALNAFNRTRGTLTGSPAYKPGRFGNGLEVLAGQGLSFPTARNIAVGKATLEMWVVPSWGQDDPSDRALFATGSADEVSPASSLRLMKKGDRIRVSVFDPAGAETYSEMTMASAGIQPGVPFHVTVIWLDYRIALAINGNAATDRGGPGSGRISALGDTMYFGYIPGQSIEANAVFDEVSIYDYARGQSGVLADVAATGPLSVDAFKRVLVAKGESGVTNAVLGNMSGMPVLARDQVIITLSAKDGLRRTSMASIRVIANSDYSLPPDVPPLQGD